MEKCDILDQEIWVCKDSAEAKTVWQRYPKERHRIWLEQETWDHCLDSPEQLQIILDLKQVKPGFY